MDKDKYKNNSKYPYSDLTDKIIGCTYEIYRKLGYGLPEKTYQKAFEECLKAQNLEYNREKYGKIKFNNADVGKYFLDFLIEGKVAVEFKVRHEIYETDAIQLLNYLKSENIPVGLLIVFTSNGLKIKRLINSPGQR